MLQQALKKYVSHKFMGPAMTLDLACKTQKCLGGRTRVPEVLPITQCSIPNDALTQGPKCMSCREITCQ